MGEKKQQIHSEHDKVQKKIKTENIQNKKPIINKNDQSKSIEKKQFSNQKKNDQSKSSEKKQFSNGKFQKNDQSKTEKKQFSNSKFQKNDQKKNQNTIQEQKVENKDVQIDKLVLTLSKEYSFLLTKDDSQQQQKIKTIDSLLKQIGPMLLKITNKRKGSKVIQACLKFGSQEQRQQINTFFIKDESILNETIKSKYGHFVVLKLIKFVPKLVKDKLFSVLRQHVISYLTQKESAAKVLDKFLVKLSTPNQTQLIKKQLEDKGTEQTFENMTIKIVENQLQNNVLSQYILTKSFPILITNEKEKVVESLIPYINEFQSKDGLKLAITVINYANSKQRKLIVKTYKDKVIKILQNEYSKGFLIIEKLLFSVDDTKILDKFVIKEITANLQQVIESKNGLILLQNIYFQQEKQNIDQLFKIEQTNSNRKDEIILPINKDLIKYLQTNLKSSLQNAVLIKFILHLINNSDDFIKKIIDLFVYDFNNNAIDDSLITHATAHRILKQIIILSENNKEIQGQIDKIFNIVKENIDDLIESKAVFILIALIEHTEHGKYLINILEKSSSLKNGSQIGQKILQGIMNQ